MSHAKNHPVTHKAEKLVEVSTPWGVCSTAKVADDLAIMRAELPEADYVDLFSFLMEWGGNVEVAIKKYKHWVMWAKENLPIKVEDLQAVIEQKKFLFYGRGKDNSYMCYFRVGMHDPSKASAELSVRQVIFESQQLIERVRADGKYATITVVIDRTGASRKTFDVELLKLLFKQLRDYLPFHVVNVVVYNYNSFFKEFLWPICKLFLPDVLKNIVIFVNTKEQFQKYVSSEHIPRFLGDVTCPTFSPEE